MSAPSCWICSACFVINLGTLLANGDGRSVVSLNGWPELDAAVDALVAVPLGERGELLTGLSHNPALHLGVYEDPGSSNKKGKIILNLEQKLHNVNYFKLSMTSQCHIHKFIFDTNFCNTLYLTYADIDSSINLNIFQGRA